MDEDWDDDEDVDEDDSPWLDLKEPEQIERALADLSPVVKEELDRALFFAGNNNLHGGAEKKYTVQAMRRFVAAGHEPAPWVIEAYLRDRIRASRKARPDDRAKAARKIYEGVLEGRAFRDTGGRPI